MPVENARKLLLAALGAGDGQVLAERYGAATSEEWHELLHIAGAHQITALLYWRLKAAEIDIPSEILQSLRMDYLRSTGRNMYIYHELAHILKCLHRSQIRVIPLKGAYLAQRIYGRVAFRQMDDVDLLVEKHNLKDTEKILLNLGFVKTDFLDVTIEELYHFGYEHVQKHLLIEVHWDLVDRAGGIHTDIDGLWDRSRPAVIAETPVREMAPEDQVLHLCIHSCAHVFDMGLRAMIDFTLTLRFYCEEMNWAVLFGRARQWGAYRCLVSNLWLARKLLNAPAPDNCLESTGSSNRDREYFSLAEQCLLKPEKEPGWPIATLAQVWKDRSVTGKLIRLWRVIFVSPRIMATMYPAPLGSLRIFLYYPVRIKDVLKRHGRMALGLITGDAQAISRTERQSRINELRKWMLSS
jgi:hypothetical protein